MSEIKHFDMLKKPVKEKWLITPLAYALSFPSTIKRGLKINKVNMEGLKPPYILLCTHHGFIDFKVTTHAIFPHRASYVVAIDGFLGKEWLMRNVGSIAKRKFTPQDTVLFKHIKYSLEKLKRITVIYPQAIYSTAGTPSSVSDSLGKMLKIFKHPVVVLNMHGNFLMKPIWNRLDRKGPLRADMTQVITLDEINTLSAEEINSRVKEAMDYDEFKYQLDNKIVIDHLERTKGLHKVLYQCDSCLTEFKMYSEKTEIWCDHCGKKHYQDELGRLNALNGDTKFSHVPDWYNFQREQTKKEILNDTYYFEDEVYVESLPNSKRFIPLGDGKLIHTKEGFKLMTYDEKNPLTLVRETSSLFSVHIEYDYHLRTDKVLADAVVLSTLDDPYYIYPKTKRDQVTKIRFAAEEAYKLYKNK